MPTIDSGAAVGQLCLRELQLNAVLVHLILSAVFSALRVDCSRAWHSRLCHLHTSPSDYDYSSELQIDCPHLLVLLCCTTAECLFRLVPYNRNWFSRVHTCVPKWSKNVFRLRNDNINLVGRSV